MPVTFSVDSRAESGMGALLIFIAMMLVSAVVAGVIIETSYMAQQRAQAVAENAIADVSSGLKVLGIVGDRYNPVNDTLDNKINYLIIDVTVHSGSEPLDLRRVVIEVTDGSVLATLVWGGIETFGDGGDIPIIADAIHFSVYPVRIVSGTFSTTEPVISQGDIVRIYINASAAGLNLEPQTRIQLKIVPQPGVPTIVDRWTPDVYLGRYIIIS